jgi:hypothetical protein
MKHGGKGSNDLRGGAYATNRQKTLMETTIDGSMHRAACQAKCPAEHHDANFEPRVFQNEMLKVDIISNAQLCAPRLDYIESYAEPDKTRVIRCLNYCMY